MLDLHICTVFQRSWLKNLASGWWDGFRRLEKHGVEMNINRETQANIVARKSLSVLDSGMR